MPECAVATCHYYSVKTKDQTILYHRFPKEKNIQNNWINKCKRADKINVVHASVLCTFHALGL